MGIKGANIGQMQQLASEFAALGDRLVAHTTQLNGKIDARVGELTQAMTRLHSEGERHVADNERIAQELDRVVAATHWTGPRGDRFREAEQTVVQAVHTTNTATEQVMSDAKSVIDGQITSQMDESKIAAQRTGEHGQQVSQQFQQGVSGIADAYSGVLGLG